MGQTTLGKPVVRRRADLPPGEVLCDYCTARCCRYFALPIDTPKTWTDFDHMRWYLIHGRTALFVEDGTWFLMVYADCQHLNGNACGAYDDRPQICRTYSTDNCEFGDEGTYDKLFETAEQVWEYAEAILPPRQREIANSLGLPVLHGVSNSPR